MNNYPYLIKAKAKANEAKSLFCWFSAKSDSRAERKILDILEDAEINVGRGASHQLPIRTNWLIVDDLPEEGVLDDTWCDRYELGGEDGLTWQKIVAPAAAEPQPSSKPENDISPANSDEEDYSNNEEALFNLAEMSFRTQLLAQYMADERHVYHISIPHRNRLSAMEMDTDNHGVQNLLLTAENIPELKKYDMPGLWKFTSAFKSVFPVGKRHELGKQIQFAKLWLETSHIDRGILTKEWAAGNYITSINKTDAGANAGGGNKTDRNPDYQHSLDTLDIEIALATMPMDFDIYNFPASVHRRAKEIVQKKESPFKEWSAALRSTPGILDYSRAAIFALIREASSGITPFPDRLRGYINANLTEHKHDTPSAETLTKAGHIPSAAVTLDATNQVIAGEDSSAKLETLSSDIKAVGAELVKEAQKQRPDANQVLAAERGEYVEGVSDPTDPKWVTEDLTKTRQPEVSKIGDGVFSIEGLVGVTGKVNQKEKTDEVVHQTDSVDIESGHHNKEEDQPIDYVHVMVDLETMGKKHNAPIVAIGAVVFDPATGSIGESFYKVVCLESSVNWGAVIDPSTVIWWLKQSSEARSAIVNDDAIPLQDALLQFREFVSDNVAGGSKKAQVWGNGASFDNSILRSSYDCIAEDYPWEYWNDRDVRTMVELGQAISFDPKTTIPFEGSRHNALADAIHQARYVSAIWQRIIAGNQVLQKLMQN
ncbi:MULTISPECIES: 3'-5' exonuclease [Klebsiella/Raoultella group]|uniref:exonuclease n=1 Tax=Klebsiella/Raoultella group TaxID=2890311 RepID=UPI000F4B9B37|nr:MULTISPECIES: exonuclease [Klebsiella/Raoultella group]AYW54421.1 exonuclease [Raoultella ornithinolytica]MDV0458891.1 3'-5' exoribonuclease [Klebsiella quasipneumoniae subsp. similipneumoniae]MDV0823930.1 3'-5' exoribonuclease [Klebsiella quasipneumoniae subsp. similipneumoniae]MDV0860874.1 3'-5' exoribonuclease [Klebsiella quasipneumoniae subsp. similipneumoniae]QYE32128.1 3'-5' exoribonuclease [Raoultella ornithinolytica]